MSKQTGRLSAPDIRGQASDLRTFGETFEVHTDDWFVFQDAADAMDEVADWLEEAAIA